MTFFCKEKQLSLKFFKIMCHLSKMNGPNRSIYLACVGAATGRRPPPFRAGGRRLFDKWDKRLTIHICESFLLPTWDYHSQCHWPRYVRRWTGNHGAPEVNGSGGQSTQLGHGETLTFSILFLNLSSFFKVNRFKSMVEGFQSVPKFLEVLAFFEG